MKYLYIGWCRDPDANTDKVWGVIQIGFDHDNSDWGDPEYYSRTNRYVTFWGRRGKKLQTKIWAGVPREAEKEFFKKIDKGYNKVNKSKLDSVYPEFESDLEKTAFWSTLKAE